MLTLDLHQINNDDDLTDWQKEELERRLKKIEDGKETFYTWEEVKQRLHNK
ncbi:MAG: addiction module protein [Chitinophagales bacterium]|nr:addiction module protein [Chitinophagales bacterium]